MIQYILSEQNSLPDFFLRIVMENPCILISFLKREQEKLQTSDDKHLLFNRLLKTPDDIQFTPENTTKLLQALIQYDKEYTAQILKRQLYNASIYTLVYLLDMLFQPKTTIQFKRNSQHNTTTPIHKISSLEKSSSSM
jgi:hypothetical protein